MTFSDRLKALRTERKISVKDLAEKVGINAQTIYAYESGERQPSLNPLCWLADYFGVSVDYLLGRTDDRDEPELDLKDWERDRK